MADPNYINAMVEDNMLVRTFVERCTQHYGWTDDLRREDAKDKLLARFERLNATDAKLDWVRDTVGDVIHYGKMICMRKQLDPLNWHRRFDICDVMVLNKRDALQHLLSKLRNDRHTSVVNVDDPNPKPKRIYTGVRSFA